MQGSSGPRHLRHHGRDARADVGGDRSRRPGAGGRVDRDARAARAAESPRHDGRGRGGGDRGLHGRACACPGARRAGDEPARCAARRGARVRAVRARRRRLRDGGHFDGAAGGARHAGVRRRARACGGVRADRRGHARRPAPLARRGGARERRRARARRRADAGVRLARDLRRAGPGRGGRGARGVAGREPWRRGGRVLSNRSHPPARTPDHRLRRRCPRPVHVRPHRHPPDRGPRLPRRKPLPTGGSSRTTVRSRSSRGPSAPSCSGSCCC
jgi:hypothetical protein